MKVLFINLPFSGHIIPTFGLVKELLKKEIKVTYLLTEDWKDRVLNTGAEFISYKSNKKFSIEIRNAYDKAMEIGKDYDLIIYEQFFFLGKHIGDVLNKPVIRIYTSLVANKEIMKEYMKFGGNLFIFKNKWIAKKWTKDITYDIPMKTDNWLDEIIENPPDLSLVYNIREFQPFEEEFPNENFKFVGSSIYKRENNYDFTIEYTNEKPLIYISFGTILNNQKQFYLKTFKAFENEEVNVILSIGDKVSKDSLGNIPKNFKVYSYVPQLEVLERADLFITHGGLNSVVESIYYETPMVVIPQANDQFVNANQVEKNNLGKQLNKKKITPEILREISLKVLKDESVKSSIKSMKEKFIEAGGNDLAAEIILKYNKIE